MSLFCRFNQFFGIFFLGSSLKQCLKLIRLKFHNEKKNIFAVGYLIRIKKVPQVFLFTDLVTANILTRKGLFIKEFQPSSLKFCTGLATQGKTSLSS